ncbi:AAA family ATPase [Colletotrichum sojae]|uniref:AAA family ATPase n=1 Tax=Colletotrichum sojae TaxID=2175907 RepID=A0A8H6JK09_9PEZI|nr:AAA family ATPase [Colletotrichum sojae]
MPPPSVVIHESPPDDKGEPANSTAQKEDQNQTSNDDPGKGPDGYPEDGKDIRTKILRVDRMQVVQLMKARKYRYVKTAKPKTSKKFSKNVITAARIISVQGVFTGEYRVEVRGAYLPEIFTGIYSDIEGVSFPELITLVRCVNCSRVNEAGPLIREHQETTELQLLFHAILGLKKELDSQMELEKPNTKLTFELEAVLEFTLDHFSSEMRTLNSLPLGHIDYVNVWTLFPPGALVYSVGPLNQERVHRLRSIPKLSKNQDGSTSWVLSLDYLDFDGIHLGFVRTTGAFAESSIRPVEWNDSIIDSLVLPQDHKDFIQVLIQNHGGKADSGSFDDIIKDKGKGLIGLPVEPPGVGKTLTAEVMAEVSYKALYTISSGELGEGSSSVMNKLADVMELAEAWNAVLLLDEADVFLTERDNINLSRNAITSVFLRHLEYFQGTMVLTTNRLESFDPAFQSRIHFCIEYSDLTADARATIWRMLLGKVANSTSLEVQIEDAEIGTLASRKLNGRQIKNAMSISQTFAQERKGSITSDTIQKAIDFSQSGWKG